MKKILSLIGSLILLVLGAFIFYLIFSGFYSHLLNPKFIPLTGICGALLSVMGLTGLFRGLQLKLSTVLVLLFFVVLCLITPFAKVHAAARAAERETLNGQEYIPINVIELYMLMFNNNPMKADQLLKKNRYVLRGFVYRNSKLDKINNFVIMRGVMSCCIADACAYGFRIKTDNVNQYNQGSWYKVYGQFVRFKPDHLENSVEVDSIANSDVKEDYMLVPDKIEPDQEPPSPFVMQWKDKEPYVY